MQPGFGEPRHGFYMAYVLDQRLQQEHHAHHAYPHSASPRPKSPPSPPPYPSCLLAVGTLAVRNQREASGTADSREDR